MNNSLEIPNICGLGLSFSVDGFRIMYSLIAVFMWLFTTFFSREYFKHHKDNLKRYRVYTYITIAGTIGVFLSADFFTTFIFFEMMSLASYVWVIHNEDEESKNAAATYLFVAIIGGLVMLFGIAYLYSSVGNIWVGGLCILFGFLAKAGAFPLHIWLPKAHPVAPAPASALLSGLLTKTGIFGILVLSMKLFYANEYFGVIILIIGTITMFHGALIALFSVDLKRTLACSSVSQIGFILVGIGACTIGLSHGNSSSYAGAILHMVNHSLIKLVLFMAAGVVFMNINKLDLNDIRGFGRGKKLFNIIFLTGALSIAGVPLFSGYLSKTLIHEVLTECALNPGFLPAEGIKLIEWIFIISGGFTFAYMTKLYVCIFIERNKDEKVQESFDRLNGKYMSRLSSVSLLIPAAILICIGVLPVMLKVSGISELNIPLFSGGAFVTAFPGIGIFSMESIKGALISIIIGIFIYTVIVRFYMMSHTPVNEYGMENLEDAVSGKLKEIHDRNKALGNAGKSYVNRWNKIFDLENVVYRPLLLGFLPFVFGVICRFFDCIIDYIVVFLRKTVYKDSKLPQELSEGNMFTHIIGVLLNKLQHVKNITVDKEDPQFVDYEHKAAVKYEGIEESFRIVTRSLSFGLILFCVGLLSAVIYLLFI